MKYAKDTEAENTWRQTTSLRPKRECVRRVGVRVQEEVTARPGGIKDGFVESKIDLKYRKKCAREGE